MLKALLRNSHFRTAVKFAFVFGLLGFLVHKGFFSIEATKRAFRNWPDLLKGYSVLAIGTVFAIYRWHRLVRAQGINIHPSRTYQLGLVGNFFNIALPGAVSGDVVKAIYVGREAEGKRALAFSSILFDRVAGLTGLVLLAAVAMIFSLFEPWGENLFRAVQVMVGAAGIGMLSFLAYLFVVKEDWDPLLKIFRTLENRYPFIGSFTRIYEGIRNYHNQKKEVGISVAISICLHAIVIFTCFQFATALGVTNLNPLAIAVVVPIGLVVITIPVTPAGVGTGHVAFVWLFNLIGCDRGADIFNLLLLYKFFEGAIGGLVYLRFKSRNDMSIVIGQQNGGAAGA